MATARYFEEFVSVFGSVRRGVRKVVSVLAPSNPADYEKKKRILEGFLAWILYRDHPGCPNYRPRVLPPVEPSGLDFKLLVASLIEAVIGVAAALYGHGQEDPIEPEPVPLAPQGQGWGFVLAVAAAAAAAAYVGPISPALLI